MNEVYLVGKKARDGRGIELQGIFDSEALAVAACRNEHYFVGLVVVNRESSDDLEKWDVGWYPKLETRAEGTARMHDIKADLS